MTNTCCKWDEWRKKRLSLCLAVILDKFATEKKGWQRETILILLGFRVWYLVGEDWFFDPKDFIICVAQGRKQKRYQLLSRRWVVILFDKDHFELTTHKLTSILKLPNSPPRHRPWLWICGATKLYLAQQIPVWDPNPSILPAGGFRSPTVTLQYFTLLLGGNPRGLFTWSFGQKSGVNGYNSYNWGDFSWGDSLYSTTNLGESPTGGFCCCNFSRIIHEWTSLTPWN